MINTDLQKKGGIKRPSFKEKSVSYILIIIDLKSRSHVDLSLMCPLFQNWHCVKGRISRQSVTILVSKECGCKMEEEKHSNASSSAPSSSSPSSSSASSSI